MDVSRAFALARVLFRRFENDYFQYRSGTFDSGAWLGYRTSLREEVLSQAANRAIWVLTRDRFSPEFAALVDREVEAVRAAGGGKAGLGGLEDGGEQWKEALRQENLS